MVDDEVSPLAALPDINPLPEEWAERRDLQTCLQQAIEALPLKFCVVVLLRYAAQFSYAEIGQVLQMPEATAKTYFQRAKPLLRATLTVHA
jgi:RNA polymerase sigma factor (sigma-70 family)